MQFDLPISKLLNWPINKFGFVVNIAIIDDSKSVLASLVETLASIACADLFAYSDPDSALSDSMRTDFDLFLVDYTMPKKNGIELIREVRQDPRHGGVPIIMLTSETDHSIKIAAIEAGATEFISKPVDAVELRARVKNLLALRDAQIELHFRATTLEAAVSEATREIAAREEEIIWRLARAIEFKDGHTGNHITRVADISKLIALALGLDEERAQMIYLAAPLHDIGKIGIPDELLGKPAKLAADEFERMKQHVEIGTRILANGRSELIKVACAIAGGHHERWDGSGYPRGLSGNDIPLEARIVAVADVFEALCSERPYKRAWSTDAACAEVRASSGSHFDPDCVAAFIRQWPQILALMNDSAAKTASTRAAN